MYDNHVLQKLSAPVSGGVAGKIYGDNAFSDTLYPLRHPLPLRSGYHSHIWLKVDWKAEYRIRVIEFATFTFGKIVLCFRLLPS